MASPEASPQTYLRISDMLVDWPWQRTLNPHYEEVAAEGDAWLRSFSALTPKSQRAFAVIKASLMAALVYPDVSRGKCVDLEFTYASWADGRRNQTSSGPASIS